MTRFHPSPLVAASLTQTALASFKPRNRAAHRHPVVRHAHRKVLDCGEGVRLVAWSSLPAGQARGHVVLIHGWEGCHASVYLLSAAMALHEDGWRVTRLNLRDHGFTHALNRDMFHSGRLSEVIGALHAVQAASPETALNIVGFSMGGNFALRLTQPSASREGLHLQQVIAVCPAVDPRATLDALDRCPHAIRRYFLRKFHRSLRAKQAAWPGQYDFSKLWSMKRFTEITRVFAEDYTEYGSLDGYLASHDLRGHGDIGTLAPTSIIASQDDPVVPWAPVEALARKNRVHTIAPECGGHCGFVQTLGMRSWLNQTLVASLRTR